MALSYIKTASSYRFRERIIDPKIYENFLPFS